MAARGDHGNCPGCPDPSIFDGIEYPSWTTRSYTFNGQSLNHDNPDFGDWLIYMWLGSNTDWDGSVDGNARVTYVKLECKPDAPPYKPSNPSPADGAGEVSKTTDLSWEGGDPDAYDRGGGVYYDTVKYNVYLGTSPSSLNLVCENVSDTTCDPGTLDEYTTYYWKVVALDEFGLTEESDIWSFYLYGTRLNIDSPADEDTPVIHKDDDGDSYISFICTVIPEEDSSPECLVRVYGPSDQFLGGMCLSNPRMLHAGEPYVLNFPVYVNNATINLTGENTLTAYWMRGDPREVSATVTVNIPSEVVCGYVGDIPVCLTPEDMELLREMKAEIEVQMQRDDVTDDALSILNDMMTSIDLILSLEENPGAEISGKATKVLTILQAAHQTKETDGGFDDFTKRCLNSLAAGSVPFLEHILKCAWENEIIPFQETGPLDTREFVPPVGFIEAGVEATGEYLPPNYRKDWRIGPYYCILGNISGIMVKLDYVYMGPGDYFTIYKGYSIPIPVWGSTPEVWYKHEEKVIHDTVGRIIVYCDHSGADSYGYKFDPECAIYLMCHHAEYYNYNETGAHLAKLGTETTELDFSWGPGSPYPEVNVDNWVAVWSGQIYVPGNDTYTFYVASEDGTVDMKVNRTELFSNCIFDDPAEANSNTYLYKGWHNFVVRYHHTTGDASFVLSWENSTMSKQVILHENMRTSRTELASLPLTAFFSCDVSGFCTNVSFKDLSLGDNITQWEWDFGDGTPVETYNRSVNPFHEYSATGVYNASLTVTNSTGATSTYSEVINFPPTASFTYTPENPTIADTITFNASESYDRDGGTITSYSWDFDASDGIQEDATGVEVAHQYTTGGTFIVTLTVIDDKNTAGNVSKSISVLRLGEAVDNTYLTWTSGGDAEWFAQGETYHCDHDAAQSGEIGEGQSSYIQANIGDACLISFYWKVSSQEGTDYLRFYIDGVEMNKISGNTDWKGECYEVGSGDHTFKWVYTKNSSWDGTDCGWLDQVVVRYNRYLLDDFNDGMGDGWYIYDVGGVENNQLWTCTDTAPMGAACYSGTIGTFNISFPPIEQIFYVETYVDVTPGGTGQIEIAIVNDASGIYGYSNSPGFYFTIDVDNDRVELSMIDEDGYHYHALSSSYYKWDAGETHTVMLHAQNGLIKGEIDGEEVLSCRIEALRYYFNPHSPFNMTVNFVVGHGCAHFDNVIIGGNVMPSKQAIPDLVDVPTGDTVSLSVTGELTTGERFEGSNTVKVTAKGA